MWISALWDHPVVPLQWSAVLGASLAAAIFDLRSQRIPNLLTGLVLLAGLVQAGVAVGTAGISDAVGGMVLLGGPFVLLFIVGGGGAGDAKLMAALGAWLGLSNGFFVLPAVMVAGAVLGVAYAISRGRLRSVLANLRSMIVVMLKKVGFGPVVLVPATMPSRRQMLTVPYGLAIFLGTCAAAGGVWLWRQ